MSLSPDSYKQAQEVIFSCKIKKRSHPVLIFNNNRVIQTQYQGLNTNASRPYWLQLEQ